MTDQFKLNELLRFSKEDLFKYKLHLAKTNEDGVRPLDVFAGDFEEWIGWNQYKNPEGRGRFTREFIFTLIQDYNHPGLFVFGGIFRVKEVHEDWYDVELSESFRSLIGRLIVEFKAFPGRGSAFYLENWIEEMSVAEIMIKPYGGIEFPGYDKVLIDFPMLELLAHNQKEDWRVSLSNVKGIYLIADKSNGKKYVGSAYGYGGIWSRWCCYATTGHGYNDELVSTIEEKGLDYARKYFQFAILEILSMSSDADYVVGRENYWKMVLLTRTKFGYNKN